MNSTHIEGFYTTVPDNIIADSLDVPRDNGVGLDGDEFSPERTLHTFGFFGIILESYGRRLAITDDGSARCLAIVLPVGRDNDWWEAVGIISSGRSLARGGTLGVHPWEKALDVEYKQNPPPLLLHWPRRNPRSGEGRV